jgi:hypothetical protein
MPNVSAAHPFSSLRPTRETWTVGKRVFNSTEDLLCQYKPEDGYHATYSYRNDLQPNLQQRAKISLLSLAAGLVGGPAFTWAFTGTVGFFSRAILGVAGSPLPLGFYATMGAITGVLMGVAMWCHLGRPDEVASIEGRLDMRSSYERRAHGDQGPQGWFHPEGQGRSVDLVQFAALPTGAPDQYRKEYDRQWWTSEPKRPVPINAPEATTPR